MQGVSQAGCWAGDKGPARDHVIVENHHTPETLSPANIY